jgi:Ferritin-like domain
LRHDGQLDRSSLLGRTLVASGAFALAGLGFAAASGRGAAGGSGEQDVRILNFLLRLEYAQQALYEEALAEDALRGELREFAQICGDQDAKHVASLRALVGDKAEAKPTFRFGEAVRSPGRFTAAALTLEETASAAYIGQAANLTKDRLPDVARIVAVEARHAAWIRAIAGRNPAPHAADPAKTARQAMKTLARTGFVQ